MITLFLAGLAAVLATLIGTFSGGGMSLILLPLLIMSTTGPYASLLTTAKVSAVVMNLVSGVIHISRQRLNFRLFWPLTLSGIAGTMLGTYLLQTHFNEPLLRALLGVTLLLSAVYLLFNRSMGISSHPRPLNAPLITLAIVACFAINILNGLFGGTGIFIMMFCVLVLRLSYLSAIAHIILSYFVMNTLQAGVLLYFNSVDWSLILAVIAGSILGSWCGTHLQYLKGNTWVKVANIMVMTVLGVMMLV